MNNTTSKAPHGVQDLEVFEYMHWWIFWIFFCLILFNFILLVSHTDLLDQKENYAHNTSTPTPRRATADQSGRNKVTSDTSAFYNSRSSLATGAGSCKSCKAVKWITTSLAFRCITSRSMQCKVVILSSLLLLAQIIEGFWIFEMLARYMSRAADPVATEAAPAKSPVLISLLPNAIGLMAKLLAWPFFILLGVFMVRLQYGFINQVLKIRIEEHPAGCQCEAETMNRVNRDVGIDLELGKFKVV